MFFKPTCFPPWIFYICSPVTALVVAGQLSRSSFIAVTPIPYSVPGLRPTRDPQKFSHLKSSDKQKTITPLLLEPLRLFSYSPQRGFDFICVPYRSNPFQRASPQARSNICHHTRDSQIPTDPIRALSPNPTLCRSQRLYWLLQRSPCSMKLWLMQRKLIINKITGVTAITDNNCVKETTSVVCVWESQRETPRY